MHKFDNILNISENYLISNIDIVSVMNSIYGKLGDISLSLQHVV
jgi:hypothetical protein